MFIPIHTGNAWWLPTAVSSQATQPEFCLT
jgi:hypothetical protein